MNDAGPFPELVDKPLMRPSTTNGKLKPLSRFIAQLENKAAKTHKRN